MAESKALVGVAPGHIELLLETLMDTIEDFGLQLDEDEFRDVLIDELRTKVKTWIQELPRTN